ncbi:uncharacterized protein BDV17DRAFT_273683 [Aspergillus undulatus]|uniref:uncharacterized protein n=1 Tax=Aspergillus undulatus TaxID=1810928 RepID=UPI003CCD8DA9
MRLRRSLRCATSAMQRMVRSAQPHPLDPRCHRPPPIPKFSPRLSRAAACVQGCPLAFACPLLRLHIPRSSFAALGLCMPLMLNFQHGGNICISAAQ